MKTVLVDFFTKKNNRDRHLTKEGYSHDLEFSTRESVVQTNHQNFTCKTTGYYNQEGKLVLGTPEEFSLDLERKYFKSHFGIGYFYIGSTLVKYPLPRLITLQNRGTDPERYFELISFGYLEIEKPAPVAFLSNRRDSDKVFP